MKIDDFIAPVCLQTIEILYQDSDIVLINKPSGLLSLSGKNPANIDSVHYRLVQQFPTITLAHRLDFGTSGIMLLTLNKAANAHITKQFQNKRIQKYYESILQGHLGADYGEIDLAILKDKATFPLVRICAEQGQRALTQYKVLERLNQPKRTRVQFSPLTGRTHQLRIHSQAIHHPILGCDLYGNPQSLLLAPRLLLHASAIEFTHPANQQAMQFNCPCPF